MKFSILIPILFFCLVSCQKEQIQHETICTQTIDFPPTPPGELAYYETECQIFESQSELRLNYYPHSAFYEFHIQLVPGGFAKIVLYNFNDCYQDPPPITFKITN